MEAPGYGFHRSSGDLHELLHRLRGRGAPPLNAHAIFASDSSDSDADSDSDLSVAAADREDSVVTNSSLEAAASQPDANVEREFLTNSFVAEGTVWRRKPSAAAAAAAAAEAAAEPEPSGFPAEVNAATQLRWGRLNACA